MKGLLFKPWKAQAIHESNPGKEWQTRRIIRFPYHNKLGIWEPTHITPEGLKDRFGQPANFAPYWGMWHTRTGKIITCPYSIGEQVYIKETHYRYGHWEDTGKLTKHGRAEYRFIPESDNVLYLENPPDSYLTSPHGYFNGTAWYKRSSLFLPADLARTVVTIKDIRAQRVQDISEKDARAEGVEAMYQTTEAGYVWDSHGYQRAFMLLWDSIHGEGAWERNDWVWKYSFIRREHETTN